MRNDPLKHASDEFRRLNPALFGDAAGAATDAKSSAGDEPQRTDAGEAIVPPSSCPVIVCITVYRKRLADCDSADYKWFVDGLIDHGVLPDDSAKYVEEVRLRERQSKNERAVIEIYEIGGKQ